MDIGRLNETAQWVRIDTRYGEFDALLEPFGNKAFRKLHDKLMRPHQKSARKGSLPAEVEDPIFIRCLAETIWKDWRGITNNGEPVPYSVERASEYLENPVIRSAISKAALELSEATVVEIEDAAGN